MWLVGKITITTDPNSGEFLKANKSAYHPPSQMFCAVELVENAVVCSVSKTKAGLRLKEFYP